MRHFTMLSLIFTVLATQTAFSQAIFDCAEAAKPLYQDIIIYRATEQVKPNHGIIGPRLQADMDMIRTEMSVPDKVQSIETSFVKCYMRLSIHEEIQLDKAIKSAKEKVLR